ncbi:hypothetical protein MASR2M79_11970 [Aminivibrio sp.]
MVRGREQAKIDALNEGHIPIYEPGLEDRQEHNQGRLHFTTSLKEGMENALFIFTLLAHHPIQTELPIFSYNVQRKSEKTFESYKIVVEIVPGTTPR